MTQIDGLENRRQTASTVLPKWLAGIMLATSFLLLAAPLAQAETRTLKLYYTHTREKADITFKKNGRYIQSGLNELNQFLRDWRRNEPTKMDPRLFDLIWETYQHAGGRDRIHVVSAYRSPATNSMLRKRSSGVAEKSQHMLGKAMDFYVPGVKLSKLRAAALKVQGGGVGYYPKSGSPFVHLDVGNVRHWPRMNRSQLLALFPDGKTMHVPTDGKPLPGYKQALAAYNSRKKNGGSIQMASASPGRGFLSNLFGGGADDEEDSGEIAIAAAPEVATNRGRGGTLPARARDSASRPQIAVGTEEPRRPATVAEEPKPAAPETILAALPARAVPKPLFAPRPQVAVGASAEVAGLDPFDTGAPATESTAEAVELALNIPLPTRRPDYEIPAIAAPAQPAIPVLVAGSAAEDAAVTASAQDATVTGSAAIAEILSDEKRADEGTAVASAVPVPDLRPEWQQQITAFAAVPEPKPAAAVAPQKVALAGKEAMLSLKNGRVAASASASPRLALLKSDDGSDPSLALGTGVRTTAKAARPSAEDSRPDAKPVVIPIQQQIAQWALKTGYVTRLRSAEAPARAYEAIRSAPEAVYTGGFSQDAADIDPKRFSGNAVTFLSVAKFATN